MYKRKLIRVYHCDYKQNVLADESDIYLTLESDEDKVGLAADILAAARQAAIERNVPGEHACVITLSRSLVVPFLTFSERRFIFPPACNIVTIQFPL